MISNLVLIDYFMDQFKKIQKIIFFMNYAHYEGLFS